MLQDDVRPSVVTRPVLPVNSVERSLHLEARVPHRWLWNLLLGSRPRIRGHRADLGDEAIRWGSNDIAITPDKSTVLTLYTTTLFRRECNVATIAIDPAVLRQGPRLEYKASISAAFWDDPGSASLTLHLGADA